MTMANNYNKPSHINHDFNITSFNMNGFNQVILMLKNVCSSNTNKVAFLQEHWLNSDLLSYFDAFKKMIFMSSA